MQTFLPVANYEKSAKILDGKRLFKQLIEAKSILKANITGTGWIHHPITKAWKDFLPELSVYTLTIAQECVNRGIKVNLDNERFVIEQYYNASVTKDFVRPPFMGHEDFHASHRSNLLRKGRADAVCAQLKKMYKPRSINTWLKHFGFPEKSALKISDIEKLEAMSEKYNAAAAKSSHFSIIERPANYYKQFNWIESDNLPYIWTV